MVCMKYRKLCYRKVSLLAGLEDEDEDRHDIPVAECRPIDAVNVIANSVTSVGRYSEFPTDVTPTVAQGVLVTDMEDDTYEEGAARVRDDVPRGQAVPIPRAQVRGALVFSTV